MNTHLYWTKSVTCGLLAALLCTACGVADPTAETRNESAAPTANAEQREETTPASAQTLRDIGVSTWHYRLQQDGSTRIEGLGTDGAQKVILRASVDAADHELVTYAKILADGTESVLAPDDLAVAAFRADVADPQWAEAQRILDSTPVSQASDFDLLGALERESSRSPENVWT